MNEFINRKVAVATTLAVLLIGGNAATASAQGGKSGADMTHKQEMSGMSGMMMGPHHTLGMAYMDNLATFARALHGDVARSKTVNLEVARTSSTEMRRDFEQMQLHHKGEMAVMGQMKSSMPEQSKQRMAGMSSMPKMMEKMEANMTALGVHLTALEAEVQASAPVAAKVSEHTAEILKLCNGMMKMPGMGKGH